MPIVTNLHFDGLCLDAIKVYEKAFNGKVTILIKYKDANKGDFCILKSKT